MRFELSMMFRAKISNNFYYLVLVLLAVFFLGLTGVFLPAQSFLEKTLIIPTKQKVYDWQRFLKKDLSGCQLQNERDVAELKAKIASLTEENAAQKKLLSAPLPASWQFLPVKVIETKEETLTISAGEKDGARQGMVAVLGETYLGKVSLVSEHQSQIRLPSFLDERLLVKVVANAQIKGKGLLVGRGQGDLRLEQILASEQVAPGDLVVTNVDGKDLLVGEIEGVVAEKGEVFKSAQVKRLFNPEELDTIFLIRGKL